MEELETFWNSKIQKLSQKRKHNSDSDEEESSSSKLTDKKRKGLESVRG
jgi:hypothetical protein